MSPRIVKISPRGIVAVARPLIAMLIATSSVVLGSVTLVIAAGSEAILIEGPGLDSPVEIDFHNPPPSLALNQFDLAIQLGARFNSRAGDIDRLHPEAPTDDLGPQWTVTWIAMGPEGASREDRSTLQEVYPNAAGGPLVHTPATPDLVSANVGWYRAPDELRDALRLLGVPIDPDNSSDRTVPISGVAIILLVLVVLWRVAVSRNRRRAQEDNLLGTRAAE